MDSPQIMYSYKTIIFDNRDLLFNLWLIFN